MDLTLSSVHCDIYIYTLQREAAEGTVRDVATMLDTIARNGLRDSLQRREIHDGRPILSRDSIQRLDGLDGRLVISPGGRIPPSIGIQSSPLSLVGYNHNDLLYSSIRANHVQVTGRPLASIPTFGGNSGLTVDWSKLNYGTSSGESRASAAEASRAMLGIIVRTLGRGIFQQSSEGIFAALFKADKQKLQSMARHMGIRITDDE